MKKYKYDFLIICLLIFAVVLSWFAYHVFYAGEANYVQIYVDNKQIKELPLQVDTTYEIKQKNFINTLVIRHGNVYMSHANCPDHLCVKQGTIKEEGASIICLPHRVVIQVVSEKKEKTDEK